MTNDRVQIPAYTDRWMMGDHFGMLVKTTVSKSGEEIAHVKLDRSGKTARFILNDCNAV